jgi:ABC-type nitrate/sulfonate/bicarbonate transport system permease component
MRRYLASALLLLAFLALWQLAASSPGVDDILLASPLEAEQAMWQDRALLAEALAVTGLEVVLGLLIAVALALACATAMHLWRPFRDAAYPLLVASQAIPIVVLAPLFILAFDYGIGPKLAIVALVCFFPLAVNTMDGLRATDPQLLKLMRSMGASRIQTLRKAEFPAALPSVFSGLKVAASVSVIGAVFGEWAGADAGLGRLVLLANNQLQTPRVYAGVVLLTAMAILLFLAVVLLERVAIPWNRSEETR